MKMKGWRAFRTHQERLVKELAVAGITGMKEANDYILNTYMPAFNDEFSVPPRETADLFVPWIGRPIEEILYEEYERVVGNDNCIRFKGLVLQIPQNKYRCHYVKVRVRVHCYPNGNIGIFHGQRKPAIYNSQGKEIDNIDKRAA